MASSRTTNTEILAAVNQLQAAITQIRGEVGDVAAAQDDIKATQAEIKTELVLIKEHVERNTARTEKHERELYGTNGASDKPGITERIRSLERHRGGADRVLWLAVGSGITGVVAWLLSIVLS